MSDPRSTYPQAKAWTFLIDTPDAVSARSSSRKAPPAELATGAGRPCLVAAGVTGRPRSKYGFGGNCDSDAVPPGVGLHVDEAEEQMGAICSKPGDSIANKENMGDLADDYDYGNPALAKARGVDTAEGDAGNGETFVSVKSGQGASPTPDSHGDNTDPGVMLSLALESTAFISPLESEGKGGEVVKSGSAVPNGINGPGGGPPTSSTRGSSRTNVDGDGFMRSDERSAWIAENLEVLQSPTSAAEVDQLKELPGLEGVIHHLLSERARHLAATESMTNQLRRREAEATKASNELKALTARLECAEQDKVTLERHARAATEEHRVERARWFVHKQELETRCVQLESRDTQYRASLRKKETEYGRLQDSLRRAMEKCGGPTSRGAGKAVTKGRGIEGDALDLSPGEASTEGGKKPLGGVLNEQALLKVEELEAENAGLRNMLIDLQGEVMGLKSYHDRHGDLVSAERVSNERSGMSEGRLSVEPLPDEVIEGMPADWLEKQLGEETARQIRSMRGAVARVLEDDKEDTSEGPVSQEDLASAVAQLREARSLLREQDAIILAAIFDRPGAETGEATGRKRFVWPEECDGLGGSGVWDSLERLDQEKEELERERSKLEKDKARFLEEAVNRDKKSFSFCCSPATHAPVTPASKDGRYSTPSHSHQQHGSWGGKLTVSAASPCGRHVRDQSAGGLPLMTFTPPTASPETSKLLEDLGIKA